MYMFFQHPAAPGCHLVSRDRATVPSPTHTAALAISGERMGVEPNTASEIFFKVALPETANIHCISCRLSEVERSTLDTQSVSPSPSISAFLLYLRFSAVLPVLL